LRQRTALEHGPTAAFRVGSDVFRVGSTLFRTGSTLLRVGRDVFRTGSDAQRRAVHQKKKERHALLFGRDERRICLPAIWSLDDVFAFVNMNLSLS